MADPLNDIVVVDSKTEITVVKYYKDLVVVHEHCLLTVTTNGLDS